MEKLKYFIVNTYIDCNGVASVSFMCANETKGVYYTSNFKHKDMLLYDTEEEALKQDKNNLAGSVHGTWTKK